MFFTCDLKNSIDEQRSHSSGETFGFALRLTREIKAEVTEKEEREK
jgi:hypothetical protein